MLPFVIIGSLAKFTNNKIQKKMTTKTYLQLQGALADETNKRSKERELQKIS